MHRRTFVKSVAAGSALALPASALAQDAATPAAAGSSQAATLVDSGYAPVNGLDIYYEVHGEGEGTPLLALHGAYMSIDSMLQIISPSPPTGR